MEEHPGDRRQNNLPPALQRQLQTATEQVRSSQMSPSPGQHPNSRPQPQLQPYGVPLYNGPSPRDAFPNGGRGDRGTHTPSRSRPTQSFYSPPHSRLQSLASRGRGFGDSFSQEHPPFSNQLGHPPPSDFPRVGGVFQGAPGRVQQAHQTRGFIAQSSPTITSDSSSTTQVAYDPPHQQLDLKSFPPLGSSQLPIGGPLQQKTASLPQSTSSNFSSDTSQTWSTMSVETANAFYERASNGAYGGPKPTSYPPHRNVSHQSSRGAMAHPYAHSRPTAHPHRYNAPLARRLGDPNSHLSNDVHLQSQYLTSLADRETNTNGALLEKELKEKEEFRKQLERIVRTVISKYFRTQNINIDPDDVKLKCYGSLKSGFAVPGSDLDLLLVLPELSSSVNCLGVHSRRLIEKAFLDRGYGARLLTKTRVPILRVCERPYPDLLAALRSERERWEQDAEEEEKAKAMSSMGLNPDRLPSIYSAEQSNGTISPLPKVVECEPSNVPLPPSPPHSRANLEYKNDVGIHCDINFTNYVAIHNTALLRCYCESDPRVRPMVIFIKRWAKMRKLNTPYHGTLSSYGYVMMVLHYLMNVAQPAVIPNLQLLARKLDGGWGKVELFEGFDIRFVRDNTALEQDIRRGLVRPNRESVGSLLRGFYQYYTDTRGFHWLHQVISIRTEGGILTKASKGWGEAKWAGEDNSVRLRYILAIEDPFETDHNIARTVGFSGVCAIRGEFRRAWDILGKIRYSHDDWAWYKDGGEEGEDLLAEARDRGDLLKEDSQHYKDKMKQRRKMEEEAESKLRSAEAGKTPSDEHADGRSQEPSCPSGSPGTTKASESCSVRWSSQLTGWDYIAQDPSARLRENVMPKKGLLVNDNKASKTSQAEATNVQDMPAVSDHDVRERSHSGPGGKNPKDNGKNLKDNGKNLKDNGKNLKDNSKNPKDNGKNPKDSGKNPKDSGKNLKDSGKNPQDSGKNPQDNSKNPKDNGKNPQDNSKNPKDNGKNPQDHGKNPQGKNPQGKNPQDKNPQDKNLQEKNLQEKNLQNNDKNPQDNGKNPQDNGKNPQDNGKNPKHNSKNLKDNGKNLKDKGVPDKDLRKPHSDVQEYPPPKSANVKQKIVDTVNSRDKPAIQLSPRSSLPNTQPTINSNLEPVPTNPNDNWCNFTVDRRDPLSAWDVTNPGGRWLAWRDNKIKLGTWNDRLIGHHIFLNRGNPYNAARQTPYHAQQHRAAHIRAKRNQYFHNKDAASKTGANIETAQTFHDESTEQQRKDSAVSMGQSTTYVVGQSNVIANETATQHDGQNEVPDSKINTEAHPTSDFTLALSSNNPDVIHDPELEAEEVQVPADRSFVNTYDPCIGQRDYRPEIPIPAVANFQFDPAQLRDISIIAQGGSGCARDAKEQEFGAYDYDGCRNLELSNEWGGGGRMGQIVTDGGELPVVDLTTGGVKPAGGDMGQGDTEGLLHELPKEW